MGVLNSFEILRNPWTACGLLTDCLGTAYGLLPECFRTQQGGSTSYSVQNEHHAPPATSQTRPTTASHERARAKRGQQPPAMSGLKPNEANNRRPRARAERGQQPLATSGIEQNDTGAYTVRQKRENWQLQAVQLRYSSIKLEQNENQAIYWTIKLEQNDHRGSF